MLRLLFLIIACSYVCDAYKILVTFPFPSKSHSILGDGLVRVLLDAGHEVTYITPFPTKKPHPNLRQIDVSSTLEFFPSQLIDIQAILDKNQPHTSAFFTALLSSSERTLHHENVVALLNDESEEFDAVVVEFVFSELPNGFAAIYNCPFVWFTSVDPHWMLMSLIDERLNPAYSADSIFGMIPPYNFLQRVEALWHQIKVGVLRVFTVSQESRRYVEIFEPYLKNRGRALPPFEELRYNASLMLGNSHPVFGEATRLPQNYKMVGGYHIDPKVAPLPEDLKKIIENAKNGIIYFSLGSNLKSKDLPNELKVGLLKMFGELKYTVLWKFEEKLLNLPSNVHILQWAPQPSILSHPNCVLFVTHGGLLSTTETLFYGKPIIGIPFFGDQFVNVERAVGKGFAKRVDLSYSLAEDLYVAINEILDDHSYAKVAKELSMIFHDRVVPPGEELVHWVEHVVRTRGAPHLRSPALHVPWYQKLYLDLLVLVIAIVGVLKIVFRRLFRSKKKVDVRKKKN